PPRSWHRAWSTSGWRPKRSPWHARWSFPRPRFRVLAVGPPIPDRGIRAPRRQKQSPDTCTRPKSTTVGHAREVWPSAVRTASGVSGPGGPTDRPAERSVERDAEFGGEGLDHVLHADLVAADDHVVVLPAPHPLAALGQHGEVLV